jgi:predicted nucleotidyltransferase
MEMKRRPAAPTMSERPQRGTEPEDHLGMTDEQWAWFQAYTHGFGEQDENGVDVSLLRENLGLTPTDRLRKLQRFLSLYRRCNATGPEPDFQSLLAALHARQVRFVLIGGLALISYGSESFTRDLDLCYARDAANLAAMAEALAPLQPHLRGAPEGLPFILDARTLRSGANFALVTDVGDVDLLGDVAGIQSFETLWERSVEMELFGVPVHVASLDDMIAMKRAAGRPKDQGHLMEPERLRVLTADAEQPNHEDTKDAK